jgi:hypothetical protein
MSRVRGARYSTQWRWPTRRQRRRARTRGTTTPRGGSTIATMGARLAIPFLVTFAACNGSDPAFRSQPAPFCPLPDSGNPCTCPGSSVCTGPQWVQFKCLDSGAWEKTDLSCVLGLNCRASTDCMSGQACCGDPYTGTWGTQITSSSCQPAPCSSDTVQLCQGSAECVQPGFVCGARDLAFDGGSVLSCTGAVIDAAR